MANQPLQRRDHDQNAMVAAHRSPGQFARRSKVNQRWRNGKRYACVSMTRGPSCATHHRPLNARLPHGSGMIDSGEWSRGIASQLSTRMTALTFVYLIAGDSVLLVSCRR